MTKDRRWMKSILAAANEPVVALPWARGTRRRPASMLPGPADKPMTPDSAVPLQGKAAAR